MAKKTQPVATPVKKEKVEVASKKVAESFLTQQSNILSGLWASYLQETPKVLRAIDVYLVFVMMTGVIQFLHVIVAGTFPYNSFLSGFIASVGAFVLAGIQIYFS